MIYILFLLLLIAYGYYRYLVDFKLKRKPINYPSAENIKKASANKKRLVCFGDSNTQGNMSYDWVKEIATINQNIDVFNAGINADLTFSLLRRLDDVIDSRPDYISILIGTNDINATLSPANLNRYRERGKITNEEKPSLQSFKVNYLHLIKRLKKSTNAEIALVTIPLITEDLNSTYNQQVADYCQAIKELGKSENLEVIDFNDEQKKLLHLPGNSKLHYKNSRQMMTATTILQNIFGLRYNQVSRLFRTRTSPDFIHLNETAGQKLTEQIQQWILKNMA